MRLCAVGIAGWTAVPKTALKFVDGVSVSVKTVHGVVRVWNAVFPHVPRMLSRRLGQLRILPVEPLKRYFRMVRAHAPAMEARGSEAMVLGTILF